MTDPGSVTIIPARITARDLATVLERPLEEVQAVLRARDEPDAPDEVLGAELAIAVASTIGVNVTVEPRDLALERLYEFETRGELASDIGGRAGAIVEGVVSNLDELDEMIESVAEHWSVARMPVIDRNIIRIGLYELLSDPMTPTAVVISEAVRLAQTYSTERSSSFVNGVLATLARTIRES
ncbi:MAG TPA: transcription antitermination factor NusB [Acidimicrobiia bacterium]|jgi:transcription antitermination factor NusB|nr:transcription antitermination factor NusB [Acidimicrobiia bacterium]